MKTKLIFIGAGGHAKSVVDSVNTEEYELVGFIDQKKAGTFLNRPIFGSSLEAVENYRDYKYFITIGDVAARKLWFERLLAHGVEIVNIIDKTAIVSSSAEIGIGNFIGKYAIINADVKIGDNNIINTKALVEHECVVGSHAHLSINSIINGNAVIEEGVFLDGGSVCSGWVKIGEYATVSSGSVVIRNVEPHATVGGVPARVTKREEIRIRVVAEIGCNHNGDVNLAKQMLVKAHECGATSVKFQMFDSTQLVSVNAKKAEYQTKNTGTDESQIEMLKKLELSHEEYLDVKAYAEDLGIEIFATAFDEKSMRFLHTVGQNVWKIPSGEITNLPLLEKIAALKCDNKEIILSTGMSTFEEVKRATECLERSENTKLTLLHCNTDYPTVDSDMNILAMTWLSKEFPKWGIGLSDHSLGNVASVLAVGLGATFIEKHFTLDKALPGPDHVASVTPDELKQLCDDIKRAETMFGSYEKAVTSSELKNKFVARKSIVAKRDIKKGEIFSEENITCKRPGEGISPVYWHDVLGKTAEEDFAADELITCTGFKWESSYE